MSTTEARLSIGGEELEVALGEVDAVRAASEGDYRERLTALRTELLGGGLGAESAVELDRLIEIALQSGRLRAVYGPGGEAAATRLYRKLPSGRELAGSAREVTEALGTLRGRALGDVSVSVNGPGSFTLSLSAAGADVTVRLDRQGVRLHSVGV